MSEYSPGVCNIGPAEVAKRRDAGVAGLAVGVAAVAAAVGAGLPKPVRLLAAVPLAGGVSGVLQARAHFCSGFGLRGLANFGARGAGVTVEDAADREADRRRALRILGASGVAGAGLAGLSLLLP